tara:strand:+ start:194 stop:709 length:516 start_codon:yes stop_codon:yes gene_type:complete
MVEQVEGLFDEPIAGESLTAEMGAFPWQRPPELSTVDETVLYYSDKLSEPRISNGFVAVLDSGVSVKTLVNTMVNNSVLNGIHTIDVGMLVTPVLLEILMYLGDAAGVVYATGLEEDKDNPVVKKAMMNKVLNKFRNKDVNAETTEEEMPIMEEPIPPKGLMARPVQGEMQ